MNDAQNWLLHDHRAYEELLLEFKGSAAGGDWDAADRQLHDLISLLKGHFLMEEEVLFPAYEDLVDAPEGPTTNLRADHITIRNLLKELAEALRSRRSKAISEGLQALDAIMANHHEKEEEIFLPMAGHALLKSRDEIMNELKKYDWKYTLRAWKL